MLDNAKEERRRGKVQLINANGIYSKMRKSLGSKRNEFSDEQIEQVMSLYRVFDEAGPSLSKVFANAEFGYITVDVRRPQLDERGEIVRDKKGRPLIDKEKNDTENIPLIESVEAYMEREVLPYAPDAWIEPRKQKKGRCSSCVTAAWWATRFPLRGISTSTRPCVPAPTSWPRSVSWRLVSRAGCRVFWVSRLVRAR